MATDFQPGFTKNLRYNLPSSLVVAFVALPLCLGIALASNAPLFSGLITGTLAGILVGFLSGSELAVSGPAAGLAIIVSASITQTGGFDAFLCVVVLSGFFQLFLGLFRAGAVTGLFPLSVIKGMLVAIGITIILKQIPHAVGGRAEFNDEMGYWHILSSDGFVGETARALLTFSPVAVLICALSLLVLAFWEKQKTKPSAAFFHYVPGPLVVVVLGTLVNEAFQFRFPGLGLSAADGHLVEIPRIGSWNQLIHHLTFPNFSALQDFRIWSAAITLAAVGSLESLLCIESLDKMDPYGRSSHNNRELIAQGIGNIAAGLVGGLPMTAVVARSTANIYSGGRTRHSAILSGVFLAIFTLAIPGLINLIPLASLAAVLIVVGFKLANPSIFRRIYARGWDQFLPFIVTVLAILVTNLLTGLIVGLIVGLGIVIKMTYYDVLTVVHDRDHTMIRFSKDVTFVHKTSLKMALQKIAPGTKLWIDGTRAFFIDQDIYELLEEFRASAQNRNIEIVMHNIQNKPFKLFAKG
jgi:MFS superfamily sulfate permease-like transporter